MMEKIDVNGPNMHPVFSFLKYHSSLYDDQSNAASPISWNFGKFLVDQEGHVVKYYGPQVMPKSFIPDIDQVIARAPPPQ
mmetsp:Transcript_11271/g.32698  ORF Transcript_11271/g.32698 Transcript_11271/m.32698 type:complete len:80 (+) Transcript_11271:3135-3374(+)